MNVRCVMQQHLAGTADRLHVLGRTAGYHIIDTHKFIKIPLLPMSMLSKKELLTAQNIRPPLIEALIEPAIQVQPNGIEMTLLGVHRLKGSGSIAFDNNERKLPKTEPMEFDENDWLYLLPGIYKIVYNEVVNIPNGMAAIARARSSLLRCGVAIETAVWDAGYSGRSESLLVVHNPDGFRIKRDARVVQLIFFKLSSSVDKGYSGIYQNENK